MKFYGKFEKDNDGKVYRTKTFICLDKSSQVEEPKNSSIIGTIFMLNPGSSRPLGSNSNSPFKNYTFNEYIELEMDETMSVFYDIFKDLQNSDKYKSGIVEIKNLFNYRENSLDKNDWLFLTESIEQNNKLNIELAPKFNGEFVFFAWGTSKLANSDIKHYAKKVFDVSKNYMDNVLYISPKNKELSEKDLSFYHPLGGHWKADKRERFIKSLIEVFDLQKAKINFE